eukprot:4606339-Pyramimonas_sp.AAC.1
MRAAQRRHLPLAGDHQYALATRTHPERACQSLHVQPPSVAAKAHVCHVFLAPPVALLIAPNRLAPFCARVHLQTRADSQPLGSMARICV